MLTTPLTELHRELGAKMVAFAGYEMPVQFSDGIIKEHLHTREAAGLFDVSHMGQLVIRGGNATALLEKIVPVDLEALPINGQVYALLTNEAGGVMDDLIVTRWDEQAYFLVVNAVCKESDMRYIASKLADLDIEILVDQALLALQGPGARAVLRQLMPELEGLHFMSGCRGELEGADVYVTCSGYTGEDGFEISVDKDSAESIARRLLAFETVRPIGLGARDSLRLEAGLCLYGHELAADISPVSAGLMWSVGLARREGGVRAGGFPGASEIFAERAAGTSKKRIGLVVEGKRPVRDGQQVLDAAGEAVGVVTSAGFGASFGGPIAMAYVEPQSAEVGQSLFVDVRGKLIPVTVAKTPFVPQRYVRG